MGSAIQYTVYCNQILEGSNKQDRLAVLSMIEAFCTLHSELPYIKTVTLQSDNAGCYQSKELLLLIATLNTNNDIRITRYIHTETQDGKVLIDAHFTKGSAHLVRFMKMSQNNRIRSIATAKGLDAALAWGGGIQNSFIQLVSLDRVKLTKLSASISGVFKEIKAYFARCNDTFFLECEDDWARQKLKSVEEIISAKVTFKIKCFAYSGIGDGVIFDINLTTGKVRPLNDNASAEDLEVDETMECMETGADVNDEEETIVQSNEPVDYIFDEDMGIV